MIPDRINDILQRRLLFLHYFLKHFFLRFLLLWQPRQPSNSKWAFFWHLLHF